MDELDFGAFCVVCDRAIPPAAPRSLPSAGDPAAAPSSPPPSAQSSSLYPVPSTSVVLPPAPSTSQRSRTSDGAGAAGAAPLPRTKRSSTSAGPSAGTAGLKRNKSMVRAHVRGPGHGHGHGHGGHAQAHGHRSHSHANLTGLAPLDSAKLARKTALAERRPSKAAKEEIIEVIAVHDPDSDDDAGVRDAAALGIYCSQECRQIDEARNALALAHLGATPSSTTSGDSALSSRGHSSSSLATAGPPFDAMTRRRSSGVSSACGSSASSFAAGRSTLSPIQSAAPTAAVAAHSDESSISAFPFPAQSSSSVPSSARPSIFPSVPIAGSAPTPHPPPLLNFGARRRSRGHEVTGGYSYRPSLMERVSSSDGHARNDAAGGVWLGADRGFSRPGSAASDGSTRAARSLSIGSADRAGRTHSVDALAGWEGRSARPPSALASLRSITPLHEIPPPLSGPSPTSAARAAHQPKLPPRAELPRSQSAQPDLATSPLARYSFMVGSAPSPSAPVTRRRGPSLSEPTVDETRPLELSGQRASTAGLQRAHRSASSAALGLMGTSLGKSYEHRPWGGPKRSESTASLSGFLAHGEMTPQGSQPTVAPVSSSAASTIIPASLSPRHAAHAPSSPSSPSSYAPSHSSVFSARSSTAGSSDHHPSSSLGSLYAGGPRTKSQSRGRSAAGLTMTPSLTSLAASGAADEHPARASAHTIANAASANPTLSHLKSAGKPAEPSLPDPIVSSAAPEPPRSFSWQHIPGVPTYTAYDVGAFRAARAAEGSHLSAGKPREEEGPMLPPLAPASRAVQGSRKRLFYFTDDPAGD